jgi:hypothetical protein
MIDWQSMMGGQDAESRIGPFEVAEFGEVKHWPHLTPAISVQVDDRGCLCSNLTRQRRSAAILVFGTDAAGPSFHQDNRTHKKAKEQEKTYPQADKKSAPTVMAAFRGLGERGILLSIRPS